MLGGAGRRGGVLGLDALENVIPYIPGEEEKVQKETQKILGAIGDGGIRPAQFPVSATCTRVAVLDGHTEAVYVATPHQFHAENAITAARHGKHVLVEKPMALGLDAFLTGEPKEHVMADAREGGIHFIAAGHYATETFGVRALGDRLAERFGVEHVFVDIPNPV